METRISYDQFMSVKRVAQAVNPLIVKRDKVNAKMEALKKEYDALDSQVSTLEAGIVSIIGFRVQDLVKKVIESGTDKNGKEVKTTKYVPTDIVSYDKESKQFVISTPDAGPKESINEEVHDNPEESTLDSDN